MTVDLICLLILALWSIPLNHIPAIARVSASGVKWAMGNRDTMPETASWVGRADRAQRNHHDNLAMIAAVILTAQVTGQTDGVTAIAAIITVALRILHGVAYIAGIGPVRSLAYLGALVAMLVIVWRIFS
ncbi:MAG: MAPEG family protein [Thermosynechococcaceae cyanobacterium MS004]|nr:MAPEG family protein [Thermosynechococcaceae cyanobacterium MS004]